MNNKKLFYILIIYLSFIPYGNAADHDKLHGTWCFYQQTLDGNTVSEQVTITFNDDGTYLWTEGFFKQKGSWNITGDVLAMSNVGKHKIINIEPTHMELKRISLMKFKKGGCGTR